LNGKLIDKDLLLVAKKAVFFTEKRLFIQVRPPGLEPGTKRL
jgi:hypothetical protein